MKRRDFLKYVGLAIACPTQLLKNKKTLTHPVDVLLDLGFPNNKFMKEAREYCDEVIYHTGGKVDVEELLEISNKASQRYFGQLEFLPCVWRFGSVECGYKGNDIMCSKIFADCKVKNNKSRFGGFFWYDTYDEPKKK